jgi:CcmD family protein
MTAILAADHLPSNSGYVVAAYLVLFGLILVYVTIMAAKLARLERELVELNELADRELEREEVTTR